MKKYLFLFFILIGVKAFAAQSVNLKGYFDDRSSLIRLNWNMVTLPQRTGYILLKSTDGKTWSEAAKDNMLRNYTTQDIYSFDDRQFQTGNNNYYRIRIFDENNTTVSLSPIVTVGTSSSVANPSPAASSPAFSEWSFFPNPVTDVINLTYKGSNGIKGIINVFIYDMTGKIVKQFRAASTNTSLKIPVDELKRGAAYAIQMTILNEKVLSDKFIKQ